MIFADKTLAKKIPYIMRRGYGLIKPYPRLIIYGIFFAKVLSAKIILANFAE